MADLEKVLADMSLIRALEEKKASTKFILPDPSVRHVMIRHMEKTTGISFNNIFYQPIGFPLFKEFCLEAGGDVKNYMAFYEDIKSYQSLATTAERHAAAKHIYNSYIICELRGNNHMFSQEAVDHVQDLLIKRDFATDLFQPYADELKMHFEDVFDDFVKR
jgi:hypothetical protein